MFTTGTSHYPRKKGKSFIMDLKRTIRKLERYFDASASKLERKKDKINKLLRKLQKEKRRLQKKLDRESDIEKAKLIEKKLNIIIEQSKKGILLLKSIKNSSG